MADKLFFGDVESQGKKAVADYMKRRGSPDKAKDTKINVAANPGNHNDPGEEKDSGGK